MKLQRTLSGGTTRRRVLVAAGLLVLVAVLVLVLRTGRITMPVPPAPATTPDLVAAGPLPVSTAAVPITIGLAPLSARLERAVPDRFGSLDQRMPVKGVPGLSMALALRRRPFRVSLVGDQAIVRGTVYYALKAWYASPFLGKMSASCGKGGDRDPRLSFTVRGPISIEPDWSLHTRARLSELRPTTSSPRDRCRVSSLGLDVTGEVVREARAFLEAHASALDTALARVDVRTEASASWRLIQQPLAVGDSLWLLVHPDAIRRGPVQGLGDSVEITLELSAHPTIVLGPRPAASFRPLPPLDSGRVSPQLHVVVEGRASYPEASRLLQRELGGATVREMGRTVSLDSLRVFGIGGGKLALEVHVGGAARGILYLTGTPRVDSASGAITIPDLDFDVHTRNLVLRAESWLAGGAVRRLLRNDAQWLAGPTLDSMRARLQDGLNRTFPGGVRLEGTVDRVRIVGIEATREALLVRASASGSAALRITRY